MEKGDIVKINYNLRIPFKVAVLIFMLVGSMNCTDQKDYCKESAGNKGGSFYSDAKSACLSYISYQESIKSEEAKNQSTAIYRFLSDESLIACVYKTIEEKKCDKKSEYIPHFGY